MPTKRSDVHETGGTPVVTLAAGQWVYFCPKFTGKYLPLELSRNTRAKVTVTVT
jgi:hypothetical protein